jgi:hypothetical protein
MVVYFIAVLSISRQLGIFYVHLVYFTVIWYVFVHFGMLHQDKSGNPGQEIAVHFDESIKSWTDEVWKAERRVQTKDSHPRKETLLFCLLWGRGRGCHVRYDGSIFSKLPPHAPAGFDCIVCLFLQ